MLFGSSLLVIALSLLIYGLIIWKDTRFGILNVEPITRIIVSSALSLSLAELFE
jgi:hypothetical protein